MPSPNGFWKLAASARNKHSFSDQQSGLGVLFRKKTSSKCFHVLESEQSSASRSIRHRRVTSSAGPKGYDTEESSSSLSVCEALSPFATPSVFGPAWQSCSYNAWQLLVDSRESFSWSIASERSSSSIQVNLLGKTHESYRTSASREGKDPLIRLMENRNHMEGHNKTVVYSDILKRSVAFHLLRFRYGFSQSGNQPPIKSLHDATYKEAGFASPSSCLDILNNEGNGSCADRNIDGSNPLILHSGACCLPHPDKQEKGGEDAYFISTDARVIGVADGIGGWADMGVDAGAYARELMLQSMLAVQQEPNGNVNPARVLAMAHAKTKCRGSSTACILALSDKGLQAANLGDSGFIVVHSGRTIFKSPPQQHLFNIPFQLENGGSDPPSAAQVFSLQVVDGDVIVAGTDGLFDNLYDNELTSVVVDSRRAGLGPQVTAERIADLARLRAQDRNRQTPFSTAAQDAGFRFYGGKMDDITVVVSYVRCRKSLGQPIS